VYQFGVRAADARTSFVWKIMTGTSEHASRLVDDVYFYPHSLRFGKVSLHGSGECSFGAHREDTPVLGDGPPPNNKRWVTWHRPIDYPPDEAVLAATIVVPESDLRGFELPAGLAQKVDWLPAAPVGFATEVALWFSRFSDVTQRRNLSVVPVKLLFACELPLNAERLLVVAQVIPIFHQRRVEFADRRATAGRVLAEANADPAGIRLVARAQNHFGGFAFFDLAATIE
jgi:hypothetical protein